MTARFFIIRGFFIIFWFFYDFMSRLLISHRSYLRIDFLLFFGAASLILGLWLKRTQKNLLKLKLALFLALVGLGLGFWGVYNSWFSFARVIDNDIYFSLKAMTSLFFGSTIVALYGLSLRELTKKIFSK